MAELNQIFLWGAILLCAFAIFKNHIYAEEKKVLISSKELSDKVYYMIFGILMLLALFIRVYKFGVVPGGFNQDGAMAAVDAKALADYGTDRYGMHMPVHLTAWGYGQMSSLLSYMMAFFIKLFGFSVGIVRFPTLIMSMVGILYLHLFIRDIFDRKTALIVLFFVAINPWHIMQSRWALDCNLYPHFFMLGVFLLNKGLTKRRYLYMSMVSFGLCMYCYGISIYTLPVFLVAACTYLLIGKKLTVKETLISAGVYLLVAWPFILTMMVNFFKWDTISTPFFTIPYFPHSVRSNDILFFSENIWKQLGANFNSLLNTTFRQSKDLPWNDIYNYGTIYLFSMPFVILGIIDFFRKHRKNTGAVLAFIFLCTGVWAGLATNGVNVNRINIVYYPIIIMAAMGINYCLQWISQAKWGVLAAYSLAFLLFGFTYFTTQAEELDGYFFKNFGEAVTQLKDSPAEKLYITADSQYTGSANVSEILTLFYHETDAEYYQGKKNIPGLLPFYQRYTFASIGKLKLNHEEDAAYLITENDLSYFPTELYHFTQYGNYFVVERLK